jgi:hypothetical protein
MRVALDGRTGDVWSLARVSVPSGLAVSPSRLIAPTPHCHDGLWMTFTDWIPEVEPSPGVQPTNHLDDARRLGRTLRELHDELRPFVGELGGFRELGEDIDRLLGQLRPADAQERTCCRVTPQAVALLPIRP